MEAIQYNITEIKKELIKSRSMAKFTHYMSGNLYYQVELEMGTYQFPIPTIEEGPTFNEDESGLSQYEINTIKLSTDLGHSTFEAEIKASYLNRWLQKAIKNEQFVKVA